MVDCILDSPNHIFHTLGAACDIPQVGTVVRDKGHRFFPRMTLWEFVHMVVVHDLMTILLEDCLCGKG